MLKRLIISLLLIYIPNAFAAIITLKPSPFTSDDVATVKLHLFSNIATEKNHITKSSEGSLIQALPGAVLSSPSQPDDTFSQDYSFHWVRDAAITMRQIIFLYEDASPEEKTNLKPYLVNYINFESRNQTAQSNQGEKTLGQPKFNINGNIWEGKWARPENDSPALRAITLMRLLDIFKREKDVTLQTQLQNMIQLDLDYIANEWDRPSYDLWEEMLDKEHFFTQMVQRKALLMGSAIFKTIDPERANKYSSIADNLGASLELHWREANGYYSETIAQQDTKGGGLNSAVLLGILYGQLGNPDDNFALIDDKVMSSVYFLRAAFSDLYHINIQSSEHAPLIGRYPNDIYDGNLFLYGNPWVLTTNALAEYYYAVANMYLDRKKIKITHRNKFFFKQLNPDFDLEEKTIITAGSTVFYQIIQSLIENGDALLREIKKYSNCDGKTCLHFSEQIDRASGKMVSAKDLTWGYSSLLSALRTRDVVASKVDHT